MTPPLLCAVTDRRRLGGFPSTAAAIDALVLHARAAADAGLDLFQIREADLPRAASPGAALPDGALPDGAPSDGAPSHGALSHGALSDTALSDTALLDLACRVRDAAAGSALRVLINDRLDIAIAAGLHGVHLRAASFPAARARGIAPPAPFLIGRSVHSVDEAVAAEAAGGVDYLILGTMFPTSSKPPDHPLAGVATLRAAVRACRLPILAIGGISLENAGALFEAGAAGLAAIELFRNKNGRLPEVAARLRHIFDATPQPPDVQFERTY
jgi:thiamine-phosphate pyrophosphorylase